MSIYLLRVRVSTLISGAPPEGIGTAAQRWCRWCSTSSTMSTGERTGRFGRESALQVRFRGRACSAWPDWSFPPVPPEQQLAAGQGQLFGKGFRQQSPVIDSPVPAAGFRHGHPGDNGVRRKGNSGREDRLIRERSFAPGLPRLYFRRSTSGRGRRHGDAGTRRRARAPVPPGPRHRNRRRAPEGVTAGRTQARRPTPAAGKSALRPERPLGQTLSSGPQAEKRFQRPRRRRAIFHAYTADSFSRRARVV